MEDKISDQFKFEAIETVKVSIMPSIHIIITKASSYATPYGHAHLVISNNRPTPDVFGFLGDDIDSVMMNKGELTELIDKLTKIKNQLV